MGRRKKKPAEELAQGVVELEEELTTEELGEEVSEVELIAEPDLQVRVGSVDDFDAESAEGPELSFVEAIDEYEPRSEDIEAKEEFGAEMVPGLRMMTMKGRRFWCIGLPLDPGIPVDVRLTDLDEAQIDEILLKEKARHISVEEIELPE